MSGTVRVALALAGGLVLAAASIPGPVTPDPPSARYDCGSEALVIIGAEDTDAVDYAVTVTTEPVGEGSTWQLLVRAAPQPGFEFAPDATAEWTFGGTVDCALVTPVTPVLLCEAGPWFAEPPEDARYEYTTSGGLDAAEHQPYTITVVAVPRPGYEFPPDAITEWVFPDVVDCMTMVTPAAPQVFCEPGGGLAVTEPVSDPSWAAGSPYRYVATGDLGVAEGAVYSINVAAVANFEGVEFPADAAREWTLNGVVDCSHDTQVPSPGAPPAPMSGTELATTGSAVLAILALASAVVLVGASLSGIRRRS